MYGVEFPSKYRTSYLFFWIRNGLILQNCKKSTKRMMQNWTGDKTFHIFIISCSIMHALRQMTTRPATSTGYRMCTNTRCAICTKHMSYTRVHWRKLPLMTSAWASASMSKICTCSYRFIVMYIYVN